MALSSHGQGSPLHGNLILLRAWTHSYLLYLDLSPSNRVGALEPRRPQRPYLAAVGSQYVAPDLLLLSQGLLGASQIGISPYLAPTSLCEF